VANSARKSKLAQQPRHTAKNVHMRFVTSSLRLNGFKDQNRI
jgi:hypothetical protein